MRFDVVLAFVLAVVSISAAVYVVTPGTDVDVNDLRDLVVEEEVVYRDDVGPSAEDRFRERVEGLNESCGFQSTDNASVERSLDVHDGGVEGLVHARSNDVRVERGRGALDCDPALVDVAREHSRDMVERDYLGHVSPDGDGPMDRLREADVVCPRAGENVQRTFYRRETEASDGDVERYDTPDELADGVVEGFLGSREHRETFLDGEFEVIGVGVYVDGDVVSVTQVFC
ncbi:MAG: CAP domain-containing protein [Halobacteriales archaeon]